MIDHTDASPPHSLASRHQSTTIHRRRKGYIHVSTRMAGRKAARNGIRVLRCILACVDALMVRLAIVRLIGRVSASETQELAAGIATVYAAEIDVGLQLDYGCSKGPIQRFDVGMLCLETDQIRLDPISHMADPLVGKGREICGQIRCPFHIRSALTERNVGPGVLQIK